MNLKEFEVFSGSLKELSFDKKLITTINAHSFNVTKKDHLFTTALKKSDVLIPDGISIVWAIKWLMGKRIQKIAGADLFYFELERLQKTNGSCFFLGSMDSTLTKIKERMNIEFPNISVYSYSPPYKVKFTDEDTSIMLSEVNRVNPDVLFIGMTAPKQEKWAYENFEKISAGHICCIGAVFDFYAGTITRAPEWMINIGLEWLFRLVKEPKRMWRRYLIGNTKFLWLILKEKITG